MLEIRYADINADSYKTFVQWITDKWGEVKQLANKDANYGIPLPILAFLDGEVIGGLSFLEEVISENEKYLWINSLYVHESYRGKGIASELVKRAEEITLENGFNELYAFTDVAELYKKRSWTLFDDRGENVVMVKNLKESK